MTYIKYMKFTAALALAPLVTPQMLHAGGPTREDLRKQTQNLQDQIDLLNEKIGALPNQPNTPSTRGDSSASDSDDEEEFVDAQEELSPSTQPPPSRRNSFSAAASSQKQLRDASTQTDLMGSAEATPHPKSRSRNASPSRDASSSSRATASASQAEHSEPSSPTFSPGVELVKKIFSHLREHRSDNDSTSILLVGPSYTSQQRLAMLAWLKSHFSQYEENILKEALIPGTVVVEAQKIDPTLPPKIIFSSQKSLSTIGQLRVAAKLAFVVTGENSTIRKQDYQEYKEVIRTQLPSASISEVILLEKPLGTGEDAQWWSPSRFDPSQDSIQQAKADGKPLSDTTEEEKMTALKVTKEKAHAQSEHKRKATVHRTLGQ